MILQCLELSLYKYKSVFCAFSCNCWLFLQENRYKFLFQQFACEKNQSKSISLFQKQSINFMNQAFILLFLTYFLFFRAVLNLEDSIFSPKIQKICYQNICSSVYINETNSMIQLQLFYALSDGNISTISLIHLELWKWRLACWT